MTTSHSHKSVGILLFGTFRIGCSAPEPGSACWFEDANSEERGSPYQEVCREYGFRTASPKNPERIQRKVLHKKIDIQERELSNKRVIGEGLRNLANSPQNQAARSRPGLFHPSSYSYGY